MGFENNFNGIYFHHHFYLKTDVSRNGYSPGYSERDTSSVPKLFTPCPLGSCVYIVYKSPYYDFEHSAYFTELLVLYDTRNSLLWSKTIFSYYILCTLTNYILDIYFRGRPGAWHMVLPEWMV